MKEITGNIFTVEADAICVTTNGVVKNNGELVMGAGIAKAFAQRYPELPRYLAKQLIKIPMRQGDPRSNLVQLWAPWREKGTPAVFSFPTKYHWKDKSDLDLIIFSAKTLVWRVNSLAKGEDPRWQWQKIVLPRPGCGLGGLDWETQVKPAIQDILDDRFYIITPEK